MKIKLVFAKSFLENPTTTDCFAETIEVKLPSHIEQAHLISARTYESQEGSTPHPSGDVTAAIWSYDDESRLIGKILTYIDATFLDKEQRHAHKDIMKDVVYGYFQELRTRAMQTVDAYPDK